MNRTLKLTPKAFNCIRVSIATNILAFTVLDFIVAVTHRFYLIVTIRFIGKDKTARLNHFLNKWHKRLLLNVFNNRSFNTALTFYNTKNRRFTFGTTTTFTTPFATNISFIGLNLTVKGFAIIRHKFANLFGHTPSGFIGNTKMPFQFFCRYPIFRLDHKKNSIKPQNQRRTTFMENSPFGWINLKPTRTSIRTPIFNRMERLFTAFRAFTTVWKPLLKDMCQTRFIGRELNFELFNCVSHTGILT